MGATHLSGPLYVGGALVTSGQLPTTTGTSFYVDSVSGSNGNTGKSASQALATVDAAVNKCTANKGDIIVVMPGHAETVSATSIDLDVAGITVYCLGNAENQATFTYSAAASTISVGADNIRFVGGLHQATFADVASAFTVGAATGFRLEGGKFEDTGASLNFVSVVTTSAVANAHDGLQVVGNTFYGLHATPLAFISILEDVKDLLIDGNNIDSAATALMECVTFGAFDAENTRITNNVQNVVGATGHGVTGIFLTGSGTLKGIVADNYISSLDTTGEIIATVGTGLKFFNNLYTGTADKSGYVLPAIDAA